MASLVTIQVAPPQSYPFDLKYVGVHARCVQTFLALVTAIGVQAVTICVAPGSCLMGVASKSFLV